MLTTGNFLHKIQMKEKNLKACSSHSADACCMFLMSLHVGILSGLIVAHVAVDQRPAMLPLLVHAQRGRILVGVGAHVALVHNP